MVDKPKPTKLSIFQQKVAKGHYASQRRAEIALNRTIMSKNAKGMAKEFIKKHFAPPPETKAPTPKVSGGRLLVAFAKLCRDEKQVHKMKRLLIAAHEANYDIPLLIQAINRVLDDGTNMGGGLTPLPNQPGLFRNMAGNIINIRDF
jgi:hypothetical protein